MDFTGFWGIYTDSSLSLENRINFKCGKVASGFFALRKLSRLYSQEALRIAYFGLIYPYISYGVSTWGSCAKYKFERVFKLQKKAVRIIKKLGYKET